MIPALLNKMFVATAAAASDPFWANVVLLMGFEGANGATGAPGFTDESPAAHGTASLHGAAAISTAQKKFGVSSIKSNGSSTQDIAYFADSNDWNLAAGNFTIECFINPIAFVGGFGAFLVSQWEQATNHAFTLSLVDDLLTFTISTTGSDINTVVQSAAGILTTGSWFAVCIDFNGIKYRLYINGIMVASSTTLLTIFNSTGRLSIDGDISQLLFFYNGYMDELRITKGVARYASDSGYTVATAAFPRS